MKVPKLLYFSINVTLFFAIIVQICRSSEGKSDEQYLKKCSEVSFCSRFRNLVIDDDKQFYAQIDQYEIQNDVALIPLKNNYGDQLMLQVTLLSNNKSRIKISEINSTRFELSVGYSLVEEPNKLKFQRINDGNETLILYPQSDTELYQIVVHKGPPFDIYFYLNNNLELVFQGSRLIMENTYDSESYAFSIEFERDETLYGLFDHAYRLALQETSDGSSEPFRLRNCDASSFIHYEANSPSALYGTFPIIYGHSAELTSGLFLHNGAQQWVDVSYTGNKPTAYFMVESAALDLFLLLGPTPETVVKQLLDLIGTAVIPPYWALGYHQCRMSYHTEEDVKNVTALMQENRFPMDAIWLARDHTDDNRWFRWNLTAFSDPVEMQQNISAINKKMVTISDPHITIDENYEVFAGATGKYFVLNNDKEDYEGICWPGESNWIDFFMPSASVYYSTWYSYEKWNATTPVLAGIWNDMNEPSVFNGTETSFPSTNIHRIDDNNTEVLHRDVHNLYGLMHVKSTYKGLVDRDNGTIRPFILTRSHFAGSQRYAAMWTGDNSATWEHFANSISECLTGNLVGMVFCGADVGGFFGDTSTELIQRWFQGAAWLTFFRGHSNANYKRREPYLYDEDVQDVIRNALELRYKHIPQFYTAFFEHYKFGRPVISPAFYRYPGVQECDTQILLGGDIMAVAVVNESVTSVSVRFPGTENDIWYRIDPLNLTSYVATYFGNELKDVPVDITSSPVFYRSGSVIFTREFAGLSTTDTLDDPFLLILNVDTSNLAMGYFYDDDHTSFAYENHEYCYVQLSYNATSNSFIIRTVDSDINNCHFTFKIVSVARLIQTENGYEVVQKSYTKTRDGRDLSSIIIVEEFLKQSKLESFEEAEGIVINL